MRNIFGRISEFDETRSEAHPVGVEVVRTQICIGERSGAYEPASLPSPLTQWCSADPSAASSADSRSSWSGTAPPRSARSIWMPPPLRQPRLQRRQVTAPESLGVRVAYRVDPGPRTPEGYGRQNVVQGHCLCWGVPGEDPEGAPYAPVLLGHGASSQAAHLFIDAVKHEGDRRKADAGTEGATPSGYGLPSDEFLEYLVHMAALAAAL